MFPALSARAGTALRLPSLSGGVNYAAPADAIEDHQLSESENLWYESLRLHQRPGLVASDAAFRVLGRSTTLGQHNMVRVVPVDYSRVWDKCAYTMRLTEIQAAGGYQLDATLLGETGRCVALPMLQKLPADPSETRRVAFAAATPEGISVFVRGYNPNAGVFCEIYRMANETVDAFLSGEGDGSWEAVGTDELHVPLYLDNGLVWEAGPQNCEITAIYPEGRNLLTPRYRMRFSVYNREKGGEQFMFYPLPQRPPVGSNLTVKVTQGGVVSTHSLTVGTGMSESSETIDGLRIFFSGYTVGLRKYDGDTLVSSQVTPDDTDLLGYNNLEILADFPDVESCLDRVLGMQFCTWFGGGAGGLNGGTRLFLGGNQAEPGRVQWSDLQNLLYFPENNYFFAGDPSQAVTAFGKQSDFLVLFKERELYCTRYAAGSYTAADASSGAAVDLAAQSAVFALEQIHAGVGCDCPGTIRLCANQLVWADSLGRVYTLVSANAFSERNVRALSRSIEPRLCGLDRDELRGASSADWKTHYLLKVGSEIFCLDYSKGFSAVASLSDQRDGHQLVWHRWRLPEVLASAALVEAGASLLAATTLFYSDDTYESFTYSYAAKFTPGADTDDLPQKTPANVASDEIPYAVAPEPVYAAMQTKLYDLSRPEQYKKLNRAYLAVFAPTGREITACLLDENGPVGAKRRIELRGVPYTVAAGPLLQTVQLPAGPSRSARVGLAVRGQGLWIGSIRLELTTLGRVRG